MQSITRDGSAGGSPWKSLDRKTRTSPVVVEVMRTQGNVLTLRIGGVYSTRLATFICQWMPPKNPVPGWPPPTRNERRTVYGVLVLFER